MANQRYFKPVNQLTFETVTADRLRLIDLLRSEQLDEIHCDLSDVTVCDSAGLALLIDIRRLCLKYHAKLVLQPIPEDVRALAIVYGVEQIFYEC